MVDLLVKLLGPTLYNLGVSEADLISYLTQLEGYIYAIIAAVVVLVAVMFLAHFAKKGFRCAVRLEAFMAFLTAILIIVNSICYGPMYANVSGFLNASKAEFSEETIQQSKDTIEKVGEEGMVLVKNDGLLPLSSDVTNLNVFGWDSTCPIYGGTGSAGSHSDGNVSILQSLQDAGYKTNETLSNMYTEYCAERPTISMSAQDWSLPEPNMKHYTDDIMNEAKDFSDTAMVVLGRPGGEGADLPTNMSAVINGTYNQGLATSNAPANWRYMNATYTNNGSYDDFEEGESYLEPSVTEEQLIEKVCSEFDNVIVVINANNTMELGWVDNYEQIKSVILAPGAGETGFTALGEILNGTVNPSGKTADTYVKNLLSTHYINNIGNFPYTNVDDLKAQALAADSSYKGNVSFVNYVEGIYVGYKFYETAAEEGLIDYESSVQYPFGYGLSYTTFDKTMTNFKDNGDTVSFDVEVTNTGDVAGKDVVEVYYKPPYTNGGIEKSSANLIEFAKTDLLQPGESQIVTATFSIEDMASYDENTAKAYVLEKGDYMISINSDSHTVLDQKTYTADKDVVYKGENKRASDDTAATNVFEDAKGDVTYLSRADHFANYEEATAAPASAELGEPYVSEYHLNSNFDKTTYLNDEDVMPTTGADNGLTLADMRDADYDDPRWEKLLDQLTVDEMANMIAMAGYQTAAMDSVGKVATLDFDGPAAINNNFTGVGSIGFPIEVVVASTWNKELAQAWGEYMGKISQEMGAEGWYAPGMNTHRTAFGARNYEYFSEDGVLAGNMGAKAVEGARKYGVYSYIKHFALYEGNAKMVSVWSNEQAIREIYLKPFEISVKQGGANAVMVSWSFLGDKWTGESSNLMNTVLRDEWGFRGMALTDFFRNNGHGFMNADAALANGVDAMLSTFNGEENNVANPEHPTSVLQMRNACKNVMYTVVSSWAYDGEHEETGMENWKKAGIGIDIVIALFMAGMEVLVIRGYKKRKNAE